MSISKRLIMACMAVAAFAAFVLPATAAAQNDPQLTDPPGVLVPAGAKIVATNVGDTLLYDTSRSSVLLRCSTAKITGTLTKNSGTPGSVEGTIETAEFSGTGGLIAGEPKNECTGFASAAVTPLVGAGWSIKSLSTYSTDEFRLTTSAGGKIKFLLTVTKLFGGTEKCEYEATGPVVGEATTNTDLIHIKATESSTVKNGFKRIVGAFPCPESSQLEMTFTLETEDGTPITIS